MDKLVIQEPFILSSLHPYFPAIIYCRNNGTNCGSYFANDTRIDDYPRVRAYNDRFTTHWVDCTYNLSGNYGPTPRYIFYALAILSIFGRKRAWVANVALVSVMLYSATASLHAILLASFAASQYSTTFSAMRANYELVLVGGFSETGVVEPGQEDDWYRYSDLPRWMPILPIVYDPDPDAVVCIVGITYLCLIPMQLRSRTIRTLDRAQRYLIRAWIVLVSVGLAGAFSARIFMAIWYTGQVRFCSWSDTVPRFEKLPRYCQGGTPGLEEWDRRDWYRWNRTVNAWFPPRKYSDYYHNYIHNYDYAYARNSSCLYPCSEFWWPMRDPEDIYVQALRPNDPSTETARSDALQSLVSSLVSAAAGWYLLSLIINIGLFLRSARTNQTGTVTSMSSPVGVKAFWADLKASWQPGIAPKRKICKVLAAVGMIVIEVFTWVTGFLGVVLLGVSEYFLWHNNPTLLSESFSHVGQWSILASTVLLLGGVLFTTGYQPRSGPP